MPAMLPARWTVMHLVGGAAAIFAHGFALAAPADPVAAPSSAKAQRFDGTWDTTIVCPNASNAALTTTQRITVDIKDGTLIGSVGDEGQPGSLRLVGRINPDGSAEIGARGRTGERRYNIDPPRGTAFSYVVRANFDDARGAGSRSGVTRCDFTFAKR